MKNIFTCSLHDSKTHISFLFQTGEIWNSDNLMESTWDIQIPMHTDTHAYADRWTMLKASWFFSFPAEVGSFVSWHRIYFLFIFFPVFVPESMMNAFIEGVFPLFGWTATASEQDDEHTVLHTNLNSLFTLCITSVLAYFILSK